jgi:hypothetical protein
VDEERFLFCFYFFFFNISIGMLLYANRENTDSLKKAADCYNHAVKLNSTWHKAWHKLAMAYNDLLDRHRDPSKSQFDAKYYDELDVW